VNKVAGSSGTGFPFYNGDMIELDRDAITLLVEAADNSDGKLRQQLLKACGLKEE
jgi:hypothetical protein